MKTLQLLFSFTLLFIFTALNTEGVQAQVNDPVDYETVEITNSTGTTIYTEDSEDIQGSPLIKKSFENGRILFEGNKASKIMPLNYDSYKNQVLFIENDQIKVLNTTTNNVKGFVFETSSDFASSDDVQEVYTLQIRDDALGFTEITPVQVLYNQGNNIQLLALHSTNYFKGNSKDPFTGKVTNRYISSTDYYLQTGEDEYKKLRRLRDKDIIKALGKKHAKQLKAFMKNNDLDGRSQKDLAKLLAFYDNNLRANS